jgi:hypothetical protein
MSPFHPTIAAAASYLCRHQRAYLNRTGGIGVGRTERGEGVSVARTNECHRRFVCNMLIEIGSLAGSNY